MSQYVISPNLMANGNVVPSSFVMGDAANPFKAVQAVAGSTPVGIAGTYTRYAGGTAADDGNIAVAGEELLIFGPGAIVNLKCGTAWTQFQFLEPDAAGLGRPSTSVYNPAGAYALAAAAAGESSLVLVLPPTLTAQSATVLTTAANVTLTAADSGKLIVVTAADKVVTLPAGTAGMRFKVLASGLAATSGSVGTTVAIPGTDTLAGNGFTAAAGKGAIDTKATPAVDGDFIEVECTAANTWYVVGIKGVWARVA